MACCDRIWLFAKWSQLHTRLAHIHQQRFIDQERATKDKGATSTRRDWLHKIRQLWLPPLQSTQHTQFSLGANWVELNVAGRVQKHCWLRWVHLLGCICLVTVIKVHWGGWSHRWSGDRPMYTSQELLRTDWRGDIFGPVALKRRQRTLLRTAPRIER